jgi:hypothetical protein
VASWPGSHGLLRQRTAIDTHIAAIIHRPMTAGHLGEWIAARLFDIELEHSAVARAIDGRFRRGSLQGRTVNVTWSDPLERPVLARDGSTLVH